MKLIKCIFVVSLLNLITLTSSINEAQYECGHHGRFEYCIDGIPGCVIGCHCHPGYYFDTDSKICEPNTKLTQDFRRYIPEPTRVQLSALDAPSFASNPTPTTNNVLDENVEAIAKDADNLSDWLYNQFFKTIENQVINNTEGEQLTRRSGSPSIQQTKLKTKSRKSGKSKKKSKRHKFSKKGLRKKLMRITEDDSLFDSRSDSSDSDTSSGTSSSSSDSSDSDDKEHGHRKIIMINKKSTPLPSFIFLPNMDTPFYPPIGLPPPPIPMYPMVPIPPMLPMFPGTPPCADQTSTTSNGDTEAATTTIPPSPTTPPSTTDPTNSETTKEEPDTPHPDTKRHLRKTNKHNQRNEFLQKLRDRMRKNYEILPDARFVNTQLNRPDMPFSDDSIIDEPLFNNELLPIDPEQTKLNDVNFKYLSQLIHKTNTNKTKDTPDYLNLPIMYPTEPQRDFGNNFNAAPGLRKQPTRKFAYQNNLPKFEEPDNSYYANLGRQIASLIRKIDSKGEHEIDIEIEQTQEKSNSQPIFNENLFAPRSFWERSIRSPLKNFYTYNDNVDFYLDSSEKLVSLEEQVNSAATTKPTLTLQQLENIISLMNKGQPQVKKEQFNWKLTKTPSGNLNINLLPLKNRRSNIVGHISKPVDLCKNSPYEFLTQPPKNYDSSPSIGQGKLIDIPPKINPNNINIKISNDIHSRNVQNMNQTPKQNVRHTPYVLPPRQQATKFLNSNKHNPVIVNYKNKFYDDQSQFENAINRPFSPNQVIKPHSYFYHNVHRFNFFD